MTLSADVTKCSSVMSCSELFKVSCETLYIVMPIAEQNHQYIYNQQQN